MQSSHEIGQEIDTLEKTLLEQLNNLHILEQEHLAKQREKLTLQGEIKDLEIIMDKGKHLITETKLNIAQTKRNFWTARDSGI